MKNVKEIIKEGGFTDYLEEFKKCTCFRCQCQKCGNKNIKRTPQAKIYPEYDLLWDNYFCPECKWYYNDYLPKRYKKECPPQE